MGVDVKLLRAFAADVAWLFRSIGRDIADAARDFAHDVRGVLP